jgi:DNA-directed RNA polymerase subunit M/transcription elongation factor TFIIS
MKFCQVCDNMYYVTLDESDENKLTYKCRRCGHVDPLLGHESICVLKTQLKKGAHQYQHMVNEFTKLDPTLPRIHTMKCPLEQCPTNQSGEPVEIVYKRYDDDRMKFIYICTTCDSVWKTDKVA